MGKTRVISWGRVALAVLGLAAGLGLMGASSLLQDPWLRWPALIVGALIGAAFTVLPLVWPVRREDRVAPPAPEQAAAPSQPGPSVGLALHGERIATAELV